MVVAFCVLMCRTCGDLDRRPELREGDVVLFFTLLTLLRLLNGFLLKSLPEFKIFWYSYGVLVAPFWMERILSGKLYQLSGFCPQKFRTLWRIEVSTLSMKSSFNVSLSYTSATLQDLGARSSSYC